MRRVPFRRLAQVLIVAAAAVTAAVPWSPGLVEEYYADSLYPAIQSSLTSWSNLTGVSLFDFLAVFLGLFVMVTTVRGTARAWRSRSLWPIAGALATVLTTAAIVYVWFAIAWGLNYAREPLERVIGYDETRVTAQAVRALADRATVEVNRSYAQGHAAGFPGAHDMPPALVTALRGLEQRLGRPRPTTPSRPKSSLIAYFFRWSGVDGMHTPWLLETLLNPDLTPPERPAVLAHEWAHLSGYAPEDDASFVGLIAALRADPASRYSAWLTLFHEAISQLPVAEQRELVARLEEGPREDRRAIAKRIEARVEVVARASWETYDQYLKSQGVREGIRSYSRVVNLLVGSGALDW